MKREISARHPPQLLVIGASDVASLLAPGWVVQAVETALRDLHRGATQGTTKAALTLGEGSDERRFLAMPGYVEAHGIAGVKLVGTLSRNIQVGLPRTRAAILLSDANDGSMLSLIEATGITALRTGAMAAIAAKYCAPKPARRACIIGLGAVGTSIARALPIACPGIERIAVYGRQHGILSSRAAAISREIELNVTVANSLQTAVEAADLVFTATGLLTDEPLVEAHWLSKGAFVCGIGGFQELSDELILKAPMRIVDDLENCRHRGNLAPLFRSGRLTGRDIRSTLAAVVAGKAEGRGAATDTVLCSLTGIGAIDIAVACEVYAHAKRAAVGQYVRLD